MTFRHKVVLPFVWTIGECATVGYYFAIGSPSKWLILAQCCVSVTLICWLFCPLKKVEIQGGQLYISNYLREIEVNISEIVRIDETTWLPMHPIRIFFERETDFGQNIVFMPELRAWGYFRSHPTATRLRSAIDAAFWDD